ncbi:MAG TPA: hypothetical protein VKJ47_20105, partial [Candidatus Binatia bacterium]|nr:hypothetical protein [Candidatus Binatia bacterium]
VEGKEEGAEEGVEHRVKGERGKIRLPKRAMKGITVVFEHVGMRGFLYQPLLTGNYGPGLLLR